MPLDDTVTTDPQLERALARSGAGIEAPEKDAGPLYRVLGDSKIPVSKASGLLWQSRRDQGLSARNESETCWAEAIRYYRDDQTNHRSSKDGAAGNTQNTKQLGSQYSQTENVVFSNASTMVPMLYAKNPSITVQFADTANEELGKCLEKLLNKLISMKTAPGLGLKPKMRRTTLTTLLTNNAFVKIGWTAKQDSSSEALLELEKLSEALVNAKTQKDVKIVEGKIMALEEKVNLLSPAGPWVKVLLPDRIVVDPTASEPDGSDANWIMEWDYLPTAYINAIYGTESDGQIKSVYEPTHILKGNLNNNDAIEDQVNNFSLIPDQGELKANAYGFGSKEQLDAASYTKVWWVWDKTTRRILMFADNYWKWPIWVWNDTLKLPRFFPYYRLWFHEDIKSNAPKGEVTYYLDQQDAINEINSEVRQGRRWARRNVFYNSDKIKQEDVEAVLNGPDGTAKGIRLGEDGKLSDAIFSMVPPSLKFPELFNTDSTFQAIARITGINDALKGGQFKTNTTNQAIQTYNQSADARTEEKTDLIEDFLGDVLWGIGTLCMMNWEIEDVAKLIGQTAAQSWQRITDPAELETRLNARIDGGSVAKPNSQVKKQQATVLAQALGQFANATPYAVIVMLKMLERAFNDSLVITQDDWKMLIQTMMMQMQKAGSGPGAGQQEQQQPPPENGGPPQSDAELKQALTEKIKMLPQSAQAKLQELVQQGHPPAEALALIEKQVGQAK